MEQKPTELSIDVEQWKRDIQTFADTTSRALNAIAGELSNECTSVHSNRINRSSDALSGPPLDFSAAATGDSELEGNPRLADLKSRLAKRISKNN